MTLRQQRFVDEYLIDLNATQAAIRAGYSPKTAGPVAFKLLKNAQISAEIEKRRTRLSDKLEVTQERIVREYARIAFADIRTIVEVNGSVRVRPSADWTDDEAAAVAEVSETTSEHGGSLKFKLHSKIAALDSLAKHLGMFTTKIEHSGSMEPTRAVHERLEALIAEEEKRRKAK